MVDGVAMDRHLMRQYDLVNTGVTCDRDCVVNARLLMLTAVAYVILLSA